MDRLAGGMATASLGGIAFRGIYLARRLRALGYEVVEVYPAAAYRQLGLISRPDSSRKAELLGRLVVGVDFRDGDELDAIAAALVAIAYARGTATSIHGKDGDIWLPP